MIVPILVVFVLGSVSGLVAGLYYKNVIVLLALNSLWWVHSFLHILYGLPGWTEDILKIGR